MYPKYLEIPTYEECLEICKDHTAFSHSVQEWQGINSGAPDKIESFKYNIITENMWDGFGRLNMRGITFANGAMVALPFPKFHNKGETDETRNVNLDKVKYIFEKVDGSLISFFRVAEDIELKSMKSVESDVAVHARKYFKTRPDIHSFVESLIDKALSPMFEYVSPYNKIVLNYEEDFIFLGARSLLTGEIFYPKYDIEVPASITHPAIFDSLDSAKEYLEREDVEGIVLTFEDGMMLKMKTAHYCKIHKILDNFVPKNVVAHIAEGTFDDLIGILSEFNMDAEIEMARSTEKKLWDIINERKSAAEVYYHDNKDKSRGDVARDLIPTDKALSSLVFKLFDGQDLLPYLMKNLVRESREWRYF